MRLVKCERACVCAIRQITYSRSENVSTCVLASVHSCTHAYIINTPLGFILALCTAS